MMPRRPIWIDWDDLAALEARRDALSATRDAVEAVLMAADASGDTAGYDRAALAFDAADDEIALLDNRIGELEEDAWLAASRAERREYWRAVTL